MNGLKTKTFNSEIKFFSFQQMPELQNIVTYHKFNKGQIIFYEGHLPYGIFILTSGEVEIIYGKSKSEKVSTPAFIGISAFINLAPYSGTARATTESEMYFLSNHAYKDLLKKNNTVTAWINQ